MKKDVEIGLFNIMNGISGVYKILCLENNRCYIGSSFNVGKRIGQHRCDLIANRHSNIHLQRAWNRYGEKRFSAKLVEECCVDELFDYEQKWIDELLPQFNIAICAESSRRGVKLTLAQRRKMKKIWDAKKGIPVNKPGEKLSESHVRKISLALIGNTHSKGNKFSKESREKCSIAKKKWHKENKRNEEWCKNLSESLNGHAVSDETKRKIGEAQRKHQAVHGNPMKGRKRPDLAERNRMNARKNKK